jgi:hypothetical protein
MIELDVIGYITWQIGFLALIYGIHSYTSVQTNEKAAGGRKTVQLLLLFWIIQFSFTFINGGSFLLIFPQNPTVTELLSFTILFIIFITVIIASDIIFLYATLKFTDWFKSDFHPGTSTMKWLGIISLGSKIITFTGLFLLFWLTKDFEGDPISHPLNYSLMIVGLLVFIGLILYLSSWGFQSFTGISIYSRISRTVQIQEYYQANYQDPNVFVGSSFNPVLENIVSACHGCGWKYPKDENYRYCPICGESFKNKFNSE